MRTANPPSPCISFPNSLRANIDCINAAEIYVAEGWKPRSPPPVAFFLVAPRLPFDRKKYPRRTLEKRYRSSPKLLPPEMFQEEIVTGIVTKLILWNMCCFGTWGCSFEECRIFYIFSAFAFQFPKQKISISPYCPWNSWTNNTTNDLLYYQRVFFVMNQVFPRVEELLLNVIFLLFAGDHSFSVISPMTHRLRSSVVEDLISSVWFDHSFY